MATDLSKHRIVLMRNELLGDAMQLGHFVGVFGAEQISAPSTHGLTVGAWVDKITLAAARSGLNTASAVLQWIVRIYGPALRDPRDDIDPTMMIAGAELMGLYVGGFTLGGTVANVDVHGAYGEPLGAESGHLTIDKNIWRIYDITLPLVVNDLWTESA